MNKYKIILIIYIIDKFLFMKHKTSNSEFKYIFFKCVKYDFINLIKKYNFLSKV